MELTPKQVFDFAQKVEDRMKNEVVKDLISWKDQRSETKTVDLVAYTKTHFTWADFLYRFNTTQLSILAWMVGFIIYTIVSMREQLIRISSAGIAVVGSNNHQEYMVLFIILSLFVVILIASFCDGPRLRYVEHYNNNGYHLNEVLEHLETLSSYCGGTAFFVHTQQYGQELADLVYQKVCIERGSMESTWDSSGIIARIELDSTIRRLSRAMSFFRIFDGNLTPWFADATQRWEQAAAKGEILTDFQI